MNQQQYGFASSHDTTFVADNQSQQIYTGAGTNEKQADSSSFVLNNYNNPPAVFASDAVSFQSFVTSTDLNLNGTVSQEHLQPQDTFSFDAYQQPQQPLQNTYQPPQQPQQQYQPFEPQHTVENIHQQQYPKYETQQAVESTQADYYSHYDQYNNPINNPQSQQQPQQNILPQQLIQHNMTDTNQYSSVDNIPHHPNNLITDTSTTHHSQSLMHLPATTQSNLKEEGTRWKGRSVWQEAASEVPAMHAIFLLLFIFTTAVFLILTEDCLSCFYILPCVSLFSLASFFKLAC